MIRILSGLVILTGAAAGFGGLHQATTHFQARTRELSQTLRVQTQRLNAARAEWTKTETSTRELNQEVKARNQAAHAQSSNPLLALKAGVDLTPALSEKLLADFGFNWNTTGDFVIVSKSTLHEIGVTGMGRKKLTDAVCAVLAITPGERAAIDATAVSVEEQYAEWARAHVQRLEPGGDVLAKYALPADPDFSARLHQEFTDCVNSTLGPERGGLLLDYSSTWMRDRGLNNNEGTTMIITRRSDGHLSAEVKWGHGSSMSSEPSPYQAFPVQFQPVFPDGWRQLAEQEGFQLPPAFDQQQ